MYGQPEDFDAFSLPLSIEAEAPADRSAHMTRGHITPPRLTATAPAPAVGVLTAADLRIPAELVRRRATQFAQYARTCGASHSLRIWREAHRQALVSLAREAAHVTEETPCEAMFWEQRGDTYWVSATFGSRPLARKQIQ